ncbi:MAG: thylakoid membrane photosystem I accumulation factor [Cyanobacteriota bacterium]
MIFHLLQLPAKFLIRHLGTRLIAHCLLGLVATLGCLLLLGTPSALASLNDDKFDGNIFVLYAGNGSLVPSRTSLAESMKREKPALLVFYVDDSSDCKQYSTVVSQLQEPYGRAATFIPVNIDSLPVKSKYEPTEPGYYYKGLVPQTVLIDQKGKVVLDETGQLPYERVDDGFREVFDLLPRSQSVELKRRTFNEFNTELVESER